MTGAKLVHITNMIIEDALREGNILPSVVITEGLPQDAILVAGSVKDGLLKLLFTSAEWDNDTPTQALNIGLKQFYFLLHLKLKEHIMM